jgi:transposase
MGDDVMISVDPHKASNTLAVMDPVTKTVIARQRFANTAVGYRRLREFAGGWTHRRWAVEGCHGAGRSLAQRLAGDGEIVLDVPAKLAARVRVYSQGHGRKSDADDAISIGLAALNSTRVAVVRRDDTLVSLRLLCDRRDELGGLRTQAVCRLHRLLSSSLRAGPIVGFGRRVPSSCWPSCVPLIRSMWCAASWPISTWTIFGRWTRR